ncbi:LysR substrate-binding domain-containing protein [Streptomyces aurantiogriseus]|uniref:LysR substrate-binding domain-containing protein n=1 Tax=Streptomyces aurantiogriseus TaxID=66870 RepID=UPI003570ACB7
MRDAAPEVRLRFQHTTPRLVTNAQEHCAPSTACCCRRDRCRTLRSSTCTRTAGCALSPPTPPGPEELAARPWAVPHLFLATGLQVLRRLSAYGAEPRIEMTVESILTMPYLVAGTDWVGIVPERAVPRFPADGGTAVVELPFRTGMVESLWRRSGRHPAHGGRPQPPARLPVTGRKRLVRADGA